MSALPPKADMDQHGCDVCFVPKAERHLPAAGGQAVRDIIAASGDETQRRDGGHSGSPALRRPSSYLARSSGRRKGKRSFTLETRNPGSN